MILDINNPIIAQTVKDKSYIYEIQHPCMIDWIKSAAIESFRDLYNAKNRRFNNNNTYTKGQHIGTILGSINFNQHLRRKDIRSADGLKSLYKQMKKYTIVPSLTDTFFDIFKTCLSNGDSIKTFENRVQQFALNKMPLILKHEQNIQLQSKQLLNSSSINTWNCYNCNSTNFTDESNYELYKQNPMCGICNIGINPFWFAKVNKSDNFCVDKPFGINLIGNIDDTLKTSHNYKVLFFSELNAFPVHLSLVFCMNQTKFN